MGRQKIELLRSIWHDGHMQPIGSVIETECEHANFLVEREKAVLVAERAIKDQKKKKKASTIEKKHASAVKK